MQKNFRRKSEHEFFMLGLVADFFHCQIHRSRRAEQTERNAAVRARRIYAQLSNLCEDARTRYMDSGEEIAALAADLSTGLSRLQDAFAEVQVIFDDAQNAFDDMQLPETAAEETAE